MPERTPFDPRPAAAIAAAVAPSLLAYNVSPSPTFLNQALAVGLWAAFVLACAPRRPGRGPAALWLALLGVAIGVLWSWLPGMLPSTFALSALGLLGAAALCVAAGAAGANQDDARGVFTGFAAGWVVAGLFNVLVAGVQVFTPGLADGDWIATSGIPGRAVGNLRQPNHLSSLLLWGVIATAALADLGRLRLRVAAVTQALMVFGVVLTASRTGLVSVLMLAAWALLDRRLQRGTRGLLLSAPLVYSLAWLAMAEWAKIFNHTFGGSARLAEGDISSSRFGIWSNTLAMIRAEPLTGVGFGEFNLAWSLTPFPGRPTAFFDHTHNLPLQLLVELGLPLGGAVIGLLLWALWQAFRRAWRPIAEADAAATDHAHSLPARAALVMVLMIGWHSLLEYPLWYSYFLLPAAWAWGYALVEPRRPAGSAGAAPPASSRPSLALATGAVLMVLGAASSVVDYMRVAVIFASAEGAAPLDKRIEAGRRSWLFAHHADYAAVTSSVAPADAAASFARSAHYLLDTRLMTSWAEWFEEHGDTDRAQVLAARLREFHRAESEEFFAACPGGPSTEPRAPFQCRPPKREIGWREFLAGAGHPPR